MVTFNEIAAERNREKVQAEAFAYTEMLREALSGALLAGPLEADAAKESLAQFNAAMQQAITRWSAGELTLSPTTTVAKCRALLTHVEKQLEEAGEELPELPTTKRGATMLKVKFKDKQEVLEEVNRLAEKKMAGNPSLTAAQARSLIWQENPDLQRAYRELPGDTRGKKPPQPSSKLRKGANTLRKIDQEAQEIRKADPSLTPAQARSRAWELNPDLAEEYRRAQRS